MADSVRDQIAALRAEFEAWKAANPAAPPAAAGAEQDAPAGLAGDVAELTRLVQAMLEDAEETVADHPIATVAGALALGIVIGRLTAR